MQRVVALVVWSVAVAASAQQSGGIVGSVSAGGEPLAGVTVEARSTLLPRPRIAVTSPSGRYRFPLLSPGMYTLEFGLAGMADQSRCVNVLLEQESVVDVEMSVATVTDSITVSAENPLLDPSSAAIRSALSHDIIDTLPTGQGYRDLLKLIPSVQYSEDVIRGPSAGGHGQDNVYRFDGVNVTWEAWSVEPYLDVTNDLSSTGRFAEPAGSRRSDDHYQVDLNYTQRLDVSAVEAQIAIDLFNLTNRQTGYNINPFVAEAGFGEPRSRFDPRRLQITLKLGF